MRGVNRLPPCRPFYGVFLSVALLAVACAGQLRGQNTAFFGIDANDNVVNLAEQTGASTFYANGVYGQNVTAWVVDSQLAGTNLFPALGFQNLSQTHVPGGVLTEPGAHATWCAALLGGYAPPGYYVNTGLAPGVSLGSAALATSVNPDGTFAMSAGSLSSYSYAAAHGDVVSTSIGDSSDSAGAGTLSGLLDSLALKHPNTTIVASAGNDGPSSGTVGGPASGYNSISVGALDVSTGYSTVAAFSSRGPLQTAWYDGGNVTVYGEGAAARPGVHLVAPGSGIVMPVSIDSNSVSYYAIAGTSFAAPLVAAGAALLDSTAKTYFDPSLTDAATRSEVIRSVLMNSADKLPGWDNGQRIEGGVITTTQALDWAMGAGRMNLNDAFAQFTTSAVVTTAGGFSQSGFTTPVASTGWAFGTALMGGHNDYQLVSNLLGGQQISVTLSWMRDRVWNEAIADYLDRAQAELDLLVYKVLEGDDLLVARSISPLSTTQHLYFGITDPGTYRISVSYSTNLFDLAGGYDQQAYGLAWSVAGVPEPSTWILAVLGTLVLVWRLRTNPSSSWQARGNRGTMPQ